jgi:hypothetical protein
VTCVDRNFPGHDLISAIVDAGGHVVARMRAEIALPVEPGGGWLPDGQRPAHRGRGILHRRLAPRDPLHGILPGHGVIVAGRARSRSRRRRPRRAAHPEHRRPRTPLTARAESPPEIPARHRDQADRHRETAGHRIRTRLLVAQPQPEPDRKEEQPRPPGPRTVEPRATPAATRGRKPRRQSGGAITETDSKTDTEHQGYNTLECRKYLKSLVLGIRRHKGVHSGSAVNWSRHGGLWWQPGFSGECSPDGVERGTFRITSTSMTCAHRGSAGAPAPTAAAPAVPLSPRSAPSTKASPNPCCPSTVGAPAPPP